MKIAIVTDSASDLPYEIETQLPVFVVPNILIIDGQSLEDGVEISRTEFYNRLPALKTLPSTASPASGRYQDLYKSILGNGFNHVISIHTARSLSGIFNAASVAAQAFGKAVTLVDSGQLSLGLGFQVLEAAEAAACGAGVDEILEHVSDVRQRIRLVALLDTLEYVRRSGRVSWARARIGTILGVKPFLELKDGKVHNLGHARTKKKGEERLAELLRNLGPLKRLAVLHSNAEQEGRQFMADLQLSDILDPLLVNVTTVIGVHVGPKGLGFAALIKD